MKPVSVTEGASPVVLALPHSGRWLPELAMKKLNATGVELSDTDWHIDTLYQDLLPGATRVIANFHRYLIDANRDPSGASLYPGQNTTDLCPLTDFNGLPIYREGQEPDEHEIEARRIAYHQPYHDALQAQLQRVREQHGIAVLYDCHSIRSEIPFLFEGKLPDFNIGTFEGKSCDTAIAQTTVEHCTAADNYTTVINARFKGGWSTRHYGQPDEGIHAIQMELSQCNYMLESAPWTYQAQIAEELRKVLGPLLEAIAATAFEFKNPN